MLCTCYSANERVFVHSGNRLYRERNKLRVGSAMSKLFELHCIEFQNFTMARLGTAVEMYPYTEKKDVNALTNFHH